MYSLIFLLFLVAAFSAVTTAQVSFTDVTTAVRINQRRPYRLKKYGGAAVVDLDRDGYPDLIFVHHDQFFVELYFNNRDGTFSKSPWKLWRDTHGLNAFPVSPYTKTMRFSMSIGGNYGKNPRPPVFLQVNPNNRQVTDVGAAAGVNRAGGRGRTAVYLDLSNGRHPQFLDVIYFNGKALSGNTQFAYENVNGKQYKLRAIRGAGLARTSNAHAMLTDVNNDGKMEVLTFWTLTMYKVTGYFTFTDISKQVFPADLDRSACIAVAEIDYDNDGDFDLYVARFRIGPFLPARPYNDYLLENRNGKYVDVSAKAKLPRGSLSHGVTVGDFDNDGWMDIHISQYKNSDYMLMNKGDGTFRTVYGITSRPGNVRGDSATAIDYNLDGRLDLVSSQGEYNDKKFGGSYRMFRNNLNLSSGRANFINVRVGNSPGRRCTPMSAVVTVIAGGLKMVRRVGSPGTEVTNSYVETLHFGLGRARFVNQIRVRYANGQTAQLRNVRQGRTVVVGVL